MKILITGSAGFIGYHLARRFLERGDFVFGIDNLNEYYDPALKRARLANLEPFKNFRFAKMDIADRLAMEKLFSENSFDRVVHLAAQAGVRYSLENPHVYVQSNVVGFLNVLEGCRHQGSGIRDQGSGNKNQGTKAVDPCSPFPVPSRDVVPRSLFPVPCSLIYASSSSVYGANTKLPFSTSDSVDHPVSLYAATKRADELMAHTYSHLYGILTTGLRFFTVYGPWGRPDMALFKFTKAILAGEPIDVYNEGNMRRDFTYIDDIVEGVARVTDRILQRATSDERRATALYNIGNHSPVNLMDFIRAIEEALGKKAKMNFLPMQPGDVPETYADVGDLERDFGFAPKTPVQEGIRKFVEWYMSYYKC